MGQRKKLTCDEETFFVTVALMYGPPNPKARDFTHTYPSGFTVVGVSPYLEHHPRGKVFMQCLVSHGEAKLRAGKWYYRYIQWHRRQDGNYHQARGGVAASPRQRGRSRRA